MFLTLTYADENIPQGGNLNKRHVQLFMKRLRKKVSKVSKVPVRYYICGEYGETTLRPHYHAIIFNVPRKFYLNLEEIWSYGNIQIGTCTDASIHYTTKYIINLPVRNKELERPFALMSKRPYIGETYLSKEMIHYHKTINETQVTNKGGITQTIPKIYKRKMYTKHQQLMVAKKQVTEADKEEEKLKIKADKKNIDFFKRLKENRDALTKRAQNNSKSKTQ